MLLTQAALPLASQNTTSVAPRKIDGVTVTQGDEKGHVDASWHGDSHAKSYVVRYGLDGGLSASLLFPPSLPPSSLRCCLSGSAPW